MKFRGEKDPLDEYVVIRNRGELTLNISGWRLQAGSPEQVYVFPERSYLSPFDKMKIDTQGKTEHSFMTSWHTLKSAY